jgi:hypothetical protein
VRPDFDIRLGRTPDTAWVISRGRIDAAWYQTGTRTVAGARLGMFIGVGVGLLAGCVTGLLLPEESDAWCLPLAGLGALTLGAGGVLAGAAIGAHIRVWTPLRL